MELGQWNVRYEVVYPEAVECAKRMVRERLLAEIDSKLFAIDCPEYLVIRRPELKTTEYPYLKFGSVLQRHEVTLTTRISAAKTEMIVFAERPSLSAYEIDLTKFENDRLRKYRFGNLYR